MTQRLERILKQVKALSEDERQELVKLLHGMGNLAPDLESEREFEARLAAEGLLSLPQTASPEGPSSPLSAPLSVRGRPCSEILIEERR
jgi:hypothetical protein